MGIIFAFEEKQKSKIRAAGRTISLLVLLVAISKCLSERISKEKGVSLEKADEIVVDCIKDGMKTIKS